MKSYKITYEFKVTGIEHHLNMTSYAMSDDEVGMLRQAQRDFSTLAVDLKKIAIKLGRPKHTRIKLISTMAEVMWPTV